MKDYVIYNNKKLKKGYTTGSCAAAATKVAIKALLGEKLEFVTINTLEGEINIPVKEVIVENTRALCTITKYAGDDPDITDGADICSEVSLNDNGDINIKGGKGVGTVTLAGLKLAVGKPAINPVPMEMIKSEAKKVLPKGKGADIIISVPNGEKLAEKTFNPRLGIVGGISILGTTGIVSPMSEEAYKESLAISLDMMYAKGNTKAVFIFGEYGKDFVSSLNIAKEFCITTSNFIGYMLDYAVNKNFSHIIIVGHIGKLVKVAGGIFNTHSKVADCRTEILTAYAGLAGADITTIKQIYNCITTTAITNIIDEKNLKQVYQMIVDNVKIKSEQRIYSQFNIEVILFGDNNKLLAKTSRVDEFLNSNYFYAS